MMHIGIIVELAAAVQELLRLEHVLPALSPATLAEQPIGDGQP